MMRQFLIEVLTGLEAAIPPPRLCHHSISAAQFGSDEEGWETRLALQINDNGVFRCLFITEDDFESTPEHFIAAVKLALSAPPPTNEQHAVSGVQFVRDVGTS